MSRKRVQFDLTKHDDEPTNGFNGNGNVDLNPDPIVQPPTQQEHVAIDEEEDGKLPFNKRFKHTLDSDEEDDELDVEKYNFMTADELQGEEEGTARVENDVKLTPFNMKEELEEGHFDKDGTYIFNRRNEQIRDNWLDNIDWVNVAPESQSIEADQSNPSKDDDDNEQDDENDGNDDDDEEDSTITRDRVDVWKCIESLLEYVHKGESVQKAIQRLGKNKLKAPERLKLKTLQKKNKLNEQQKVSLDEDEQKTIELNRLIELADRLVSSGDVSLYEKTHEMIAFALDNHRKEFECSAENDMFGDDFESTTTTSDTTDATADKVTT